MSPLVGLLVVALAATGREAIRRGRQGAVRRRLDAGVDAPREPARDHLPAVPPAVARMLDDAGLDVDARLAWTAWLVAVCTLSAAALLLAGLGSALLVLSLGATVPFLGLRSRRGQGQARLERGLPAALEAVARSLRSGASLRQAVAEAGAATPGRLGKELLGVARQVEQGATLVAALEALAGRQPGPGVRLTVAALCLGVETGGAQARAVDGVAATLRDRLAVAAEVKALSSQARISAVVIGLAPLVFGAFAMTTDPRTGQFLFHTPAGLALLAVGCALDGLGWLWMQRLARVPA